ncbi:tape measure protein [Faecalispora jeddahensis]|uniref:tape measure protein n=1 Tax=Faecalispora jeddahensis TaxID=1414721 RepID=UPI00189B75EB|nr:tape measure protein [Faecalispora jeddahensis]
MATIRTAIALYDGVTAPLKSMNRAMDIVLNSFEAIQTASGNAVDTSAIREAREELARTETALDGIERNIRENEQQQQRFNNSIQAGNNAANGLWGKIKGIAATIGTMIGINKVLGLSDQMASTKARLNLLVDDGGSVAELEKKIMGSAMRSRSAYLDTASAVAKLGLNAGAAFASNDELIGFMEQVNKQFVIGGASAQEQSNAMIQLTQAMAAGALRGEELNSILDGAPGIARAIEQYMGIAEGSIKSVASEGLVTAEVVKNALFSVAEETNAKFESMPMTWAQIWTSMQNKALSIFNPILTKINQVGNSERFTQVTDGIINGLAGIAAIATWVFDLMVTIGSGIVDNWSWIEPLLWGVVGALIAYNGYMIAYNTIQAIGNGLAAISAARSAIKTGATIAEAAATTTATGAQVGLNAALLACPLTWIILLIIAVIAVIYAAVAAVNHFAGTSVSATGIIAGTFAVLGAHIINTFVVPAWNAFAAVANFFGNVFNDPVAAIKVLFYDMAQTVIGYILNMARAIENLINKIPGVQVDITSGLDSFYKGLEEASQKVKDESGWVEYVQKMDFIDYSDAAKAGYYFGQGIDDKVSGLFDFQNMDSLDAYGLGNTLDGIYSNTGDTAGNTAAMADALEITEEDLSYLRDMAERDAINRFTTAEIKVEQHNENHISSDTDIDGILDAWAYDFAEKLENSPEGVHE